MNRLGFYDRVIEPYDKRGEELSTVQEEVEEIYNSFRVEALYVKGNMPTNKLLFQSMTLKFHFLIYKSLNVPNLKGLITVPNIKLESLRTGYQSHN